MNTSQSVPHKSVLRVPSGNVLVNKRWRGTQVAQELQALPSRGSSVIFSDSMGFVDFFPSDSSPVIYITEADFLTGISHKERVKLLSKEYQLCGVVLVDYTSMEGYNDLQSLCIDLELTMIPISNQAEIPVLLSSLSSVDSRLANNPFKISHSNIEGNVEKEQIALLKRIPNVGDIIARKLLKSYGHVRAIASLSEERLSSKIGEQLGKAVFEYFREKANL